MVNYYSLVSGCAIEPVCGENFSASVGQVMRALFSSELALKLSLKGQNNKYKLDGTRNYGLIAGESSTLLCAREELNAKKNVKGYLVFFFSH